MVKAAKNADLFVKDAESIAMNVTSFSAMIVDIAENVQEKNSGVKDVIVVAVVWNCALSVK